MVRTPARPTGRRRALAAALPGALCLAGLAVAPPARAAASMARGAGPAAHGAGPAAYRLRLSHRIDAASGEHEFRAASSRDGRHWTLGGVWTLPAGTRPRIGLISHGGAGAIAEFDYVRIYRP